MEAMACRTPVVATQTGWPAEALVQGVNGACVPVDDVGALERETERILRLTDADWRAMSEAAYETVRANSWEHSTDLFEKALQRASAQVG
jgi:glycosyltransferase involved in cell wall biosynthesis